MARLALFITATLVAMLPTLTRAADQQDQPKQLTLSQAIPIAFTNNSILCAAQSRLDEASGRYAQARSPLVPQLGLDTRQSYLTINLIGLGIDIPDNLTKDRVKQGVSAPNERGRTDQGFPSTRSFPNVRFAEAGVICG